MTLRRTGDWGRTQPLRSHTPLRSSKPLVSHSELTRTPIARKIRTHEDVRAARRPLVEPAEKPTKGAVKARSGGGTGPTAKTVQLVKARAANRCERCGRSVENVRAAVHHRRPRGMGGTIRPGTNCPSNLLLLDEACHLSVESSRQISRERGWLVRQEHDPSRVPVWLAGRGWHLLTADGGTTPIERNAA